MGPWSVVQDRSRPSRRMLWNATKGCILYIHLEWHAGYKHHQHWCVEVMVVRANLEWLRAWEGWLPENRQYLKNVPQLGCIRSEKGNVKHTLFKNWRRKKDHKMEECRTEAEELVLPVRWSFLLHRYCYSRTSQKCSFQMYYATRP